MRSKLKIIVLLSMVASLLMVAGSPIIAQQKLEGYYNLSEFEKLTGKTIDKFNEAPMLKVKVAAGELPPVEKRLPKEPLVQIPWNEIGKYGGTLRFCGTYATSDVILRHIANLNLITRPPGGMDVFSGLAGPSQPGILESWSMSPDGKIFTAKIREGIKWSDGMPVTTEDLKYHINDLRNKEVLPVTAKWLQWGGKETKLEIVDEYTFRFFFAEPYGAFVENEIRKWAGTWAKLIRPAHYLKQFHKNYTSWDELLPKMKKLGYNKKEEWANFYLTVNPKGLYAGRWMLPEYPTLDPYIFVKDLGGGNWTGERNPYFCMVDPEGNQLPYIDRYQRKHVANKEVLNMAIIAGNTDIQGQVLSIDDYPLYVEHEEEGNYNILLLPAWQDQLQIFLFNLAHEDEVLRKILQDVRFRRAMSLAFDREHIKESVFMGTGRPAQVAPRPSSDFYEEGMEESYAQYDPEQARKLLDEMGLVDTNDDGWRDRPDGETLLIPFEFSLIGPFSIQGAEFAKRYWEDIGVKVAVKQVESSYRGELMKANKLVVTGWWLGGAGESLIQNWWFGFSIPAPEWKKWIETNGEKGIEPPPWAKEMVRLQEELVVNSSKEERIEIGKKIWRMQADKLVIIGLVAGGETPFVYSKDLGNIAGAEERGSTNIGVLEPASQWYFKNPERRE